MTRTDPKRDSISKYVGRAVFKLYINRFYPIQNKRFYSFFKWIFRNKFWSYKDDPIMKSHQIYPKFWLARTILARAHFRARALRIFYHLCQKNMIFEFSQRCEIRRAPRAEVRARQNFFWKCNLHDKISLQIFLFGHNSKSEFFRAI